MAIGYQTKSPLTKQEMEEVLANLGLSKRDQQIIIMAEGLFGEPTVPMKDVASKFGIAPATAGAIKKNAFDKMQRVKTRRELLKKYANG